MYSFGQRLIKALIDLICFLVQIVDQYEYYLRFVYHSISFECSTLVFLWTSCATHVILLVSQNLSKYETKHFVCLQAFGPACILVFFFLYAG